MPGGKIGMVIVAGGGMLAAIFAIIVGFYPPSQLTVGSNAFYIIFLLIGSLVFVLAPLLIHRFRKKSWMPQNSDR